MSDPRPADLTAQGPNVVTLLHGWTARFGDFERQWDEATSAIADCEDGPDKALAEHEAKQRREAGFQRLCAEATADFARLAAPSRGQGEAFVDGFVLEWVGSKSIAGDTFRTSVANVKQKLAEAMATGAYPDGTFQIIPARITRSPAPVASPAIDPETTGTFGTAPAALRNVSCTMANCEGRCGICATCECGFLVAKCQQCHAPPAGPETGPNVVVDGRMVRIRQTDPIDGNVYRVEVLREELEWALGASPLTDEQEAVAVAEAIAELRRVEEVAQAERQGPNFDVITVLSDALIAQRSALSAATERLTQPETDINGEPHVHDQHGIPWRERALTRGNILRYIAFVTTGDENGDAQSGVDRLKSDRAAALKLAGEAVEMCEAIREGSVVFTAAHQLASLRSRLAELQK